MTIPSTSALRVGTRGSVLARRQAQMVVERLQRVAPTLTCQVQIIRTQGDETQENDASQFEGQGAFVHSIETALVADEIDAAVHSAKDMPSISSIGLVVAAYLRREDPRDALITRSGVTLADLPRGAIVGTGSPRRRALLLGARADLEVRPIRGNVDTRLRRVEAGDVDAIVVASAGLGRLGRGPREEQILDPSTFIPAVGQGILAVQVRENDAATRDLVAPLDDAETRACATAERAVALALGAGCQTPFGAFARVHGRQLHLSAFVAVEGRGLVREEGEGHVSEAAQIGATVGRRLLERSE